MSVTVPLLTAPFILATPGGLTSTTVKVPSLPLGLNASPVSGSKSAPSGPLPILYVVNTRPVLASKTTIFSFEHAA